jgi:hypothetical protein
MTRAAMFRLAALALGLVAAAGVVLVAEVRTGRHEAETGVLFPVDEPGRKYALDPDRVPDLNPAGFNDGEWVRPKPDGTLRVALLGDSVAFGSGLAQDEVFPQIAEALVREAGRPIEVLNLSIYGYDVEQEAATLRYQGWDLEPDLVVYAWFSNDQIPSTLLRVGSEDLPVFVGTALPPGLELQGGDALVWLARRSALARRYLGDKVARHMKTGKSKRGDDAFFDAHLQSMIADAAAHDVPLVVYGVAPHVLADPDLDRCDTNTGRGSRFCSSQLARHEDMWRQMHALGLPFVSSVPWLRGGDALSYFRTQNPEDPHHPNAGGHKLLGAGLADLVSRWDDGVDLRVAHPPPDAPAGKQPRRRASPDGAKGPPLSDSEAFTGPTGDPAVDERSNRPPRPDKR